MIPCHINAIINSAIYLERNGCLKRFYTKLFDFGNDTRNVRDVAHLIASLNGKTEQQLNSMSAAKNLGWYSNQDLFSQVHWRTFLWHHYSSRSTCREMLYKKMFLKIFQGSKKTPAPEFLFNETSDLQPAVLLKKRLRHRCFPMNYAKSLGRPFLQNIST